MTMARRSRGQMPNDMPRNEYGYPVGAQRAAHNLPNGQQRPLNAVDSSGREMPLFLEGVPPLTQEQINAGQQPRTPRYYCPSCKTGTLPLGGGVCAECGVKWRVGDNMMRGVGLEMP